MTQMTEKTAAESVAQISTGTVPDFDFDSKAHADVLSDTKASSSISSSNQDEKVAARAAVTEGGAVASNEIHETGSEDEPEVPYNKKRLRPLAFLKTKQFWIVLIIGQILSLSITSTNTLTTFLANGGNSMPAFQSLFNYVLLCLIFVPYAIYKMGFKGYCRMIYTSGWKYFILAFLDVQGNYFIVKAYNYTNMLAAALLDNLSIVFVVILSFLFLKVRYHWTQLLGTLVCIIGVVLVIVSNLLTGQNYKAVDALKGDLFVVLSAFCYGSSNVLEEFLLSKRPVYEVLSQMGFFGMWIIGVQAAIFERSSIAEAQWSGKVGGYFTGYTLSLLILYLLAPIMFRMSSSAFYNISLLTSDFWALLIGTRVFGYYVYWLYPVGFVFTVLGVIIYYLVPLTPLGESVKPWLGENQKGGIVGFGTARRAGDEDLDVSHEGVEATEKTATSTEVEPTGTAGFFQKTFDKFSTNFVTK